MSDASKREEKEERALEKRNLVDARRLRGIYFIDPEDEEFQLTRKKKLVESLKFR